MNEIFRSAKYTGAAAVAIDFTPSSTKDPVKFSVREVRVHLSAAGGAAENLVISLDSGSGSAYDVVFSTTAMVAATDVVYVPEVAHIFEKTDVFKIVYANSNGRTYGIEIIYAIE